MGRYDLLDGLQSAFIKGSLDDSQTNYGTKSKPVFRLSIRTNSIRYSNAPPLVNETYERASVSL